MHHVRVGESAYHLRDRVRLSNVGKELVAETLTNRGTAHDAGDVNETYGSWQDAFASENLRQALESGIGKVYHTDIRLNGCERIVCRQHVVFSECVEKS